MTMVIVHLLLLLWKREVYQASRWFTWLRAADRVLTYSFNIPTLVLHRGKYAVSLHCNCPQFFLVSTTRVTMKAGQFTAFIDVNKQLEDA